MSQFIVKNYEFNPAGGLVTFADITDAQLEGVQLITNITTGDIIYQFNSTQKGGTLENGRLRLEYDTTEMSADDPLQIIYNTPETEDPAIALREIADTLLLVAQTMLRAQPRQDAGGRVVVNGSEVPQQVTGSISLSGGTLPLVTDMRNMSGQPIYSVFDRPSYIYDNIEVS